MAGGAIQKNTLLKRQRLPWVNKPQMVGVGMITAAILYYTVNHFFPYHRVLFATPTMRVATGVFLLVWMGMLWNMFSAREDGDKSDIRFWNRRRHELLGATIPLPYFLHAETPGYGMLFLMSLVLVATLVVGMFSPRTLRGLFPDRKFPSGALFRSGWLLVHVLLSTILLGLIGLHIYTVSWYH